MESHHLSQNWKIGGVDWVFLGKTVTHTVKLMDMNNRKRQKQPRVCWQLLLWFQYAISGDYILVEKLDNKVSSAFLLLLINSYNVTNHSMGEGCHAESSNCPSKNGGLMKCPSATIYNPSISGADLFWCLYLNGPAWGNILLKQSNKWMATMFVCFECLWAFPQSKAAAWKPHDNREMEEVLYCRTTQRDKTPGGSLPSPSAARKPSCCRSLASFASERNDRGSVMARSQMTRRLSWTLLLARLCMRAGYFMPCSLDAAAMRVIQSDLMFRFFSLLALVAYTNALLTAFTARL